MSYLEFSSCMLNECINSVICPIQFSSQPVIQRLSLAKNKLRDHQLAVLINKWQGTEAKVLGVELSPGNNISEDGMEQLEKFLSRRQNVSEMDETETGTETETETEAGTDASDAMSSNRSSALNSNGPVTGKPPIPQTQKSSGGLSDAGGKDDSKGPSQPSGTQESVEEEETRSEVSTPRQKSNRMSYNNFLWPHVRLRK